MKGIVAFVKTTVIGGVVFLIPVILILMVLGKAFQFLQRLSQSLAHLIQMESLAGIALADIFALVILAVICFVAGIVARTTLAAKAVQKAESRVLWQIPGYGFIKGLTDSLNPSDEPSTLQPVLVRLDDCWQIAYEIERTADGRVSVFMPDAPNPWSGSVILVAEDRIEPIKASMMAVVGSLRQLGRGAEKLID